MLIDLDSPRPHFFVFLTNQRRGVFELMETIQLAHWERLGKSSFEGKLINLKYQAAPSY